MLVGGAIGVLSWCSGSLPKRRCRRRDRRDIGTHRWIGLRVIADNRVNIGRTMEKRVAKPSRRHYHVCRPAGRPRRALLAGRD
jgi:hypothetical protein